MSVADLHAFRAVLQEWADNPRAWVLQANPVWASTETINEIALFDTREAAEAYERASRLPEVVCTTDNISRSYRPDSLLYDYNPPSLDGTFYLGEPALVPAYPWRRYRELAENPAPPSGPVPQMHTYDGPRYGVDYDVGFGGPYSNMDRARPDQPPAVPTEADVARQQQAEKQAAALLAGVALGVQAHESGEGEP